MRVLVLHTGSDWLGPALTRAGHQVLQLVPASLVQVLRAADPDGTFYTIDRWSDREGLRRLADSLDGVQAVATVHEGAVRAAAELRELWRLPGLEPEDAEACTNKDAAKRRLRAVGIPVAPHTVRRRAEEVAAAGDELGWPVVVKPARGGGATKTYRIEDVAELAELTALGVFDAPGPDVGGRFAAAGFTRSLHQDGGFLVEKWIAGREYFVDLYLSRGRTLLACPGRYSAPLLEGLGLTQWDTLLPAGDLEGSQAVALAERAAHVLGIDDGAVHAEMFHTPAGEWVIGEVAARPGGGGIQQLCALQHGADIEAAMAALVTGERPDLAPDPQFPVLTNIVLAAPAGIVTHVATAKELEAVPGVVEVDLHLHIGEPVPDPFGTFTGAGRVVVASEDLDSVGPNVDRVLEVLALRVATQLPLPIGATR